MRILGTTVKTSTILALLFLTIAAYHFFVTLLFLRVAIPTVAIVKGFRRQPVTYNVEGGHGGWRDTYISNFPIIKFYNETGNEYELLKPNPFGVYEEGQAIDILYDPKNPGNSYQKTIGAVWGTCILFSFLSFVIFFYRLSIIIKEHRARQIKQANGKKRR
jgi:hypothetical protein